MCYNIRVKEIKKDFQGVQELGGEKKELLKKYISAVNIGL